MKKLFFVQIILVGVVSRVEGEDYTFSTIRFSFTVFPVRYNFLPRDIGTQAMDGGQLRFTRGTHESIMLEGDDISLLWAPSLSELCGACRCEESNPVWSYCDSTR